MLLSESWYFCWACDNSDRIHGWRTLQSGGCSLEYKMSAMKLDTPLDECAHQLTLHLFKVTA